jgi:acyl-CoA synthetase (AMP-forming)/AMP-acid ligase II
MRSLELVRPAAFAFSSKTPTLRDAEDICHELRQRFAPKVLLHFATNEPCPAGADDDREFLQSAVRIAEELGLTLSVQRTRGEGGAPLIPGAPSVAEEVSENDGALVIFTTGSTGSPKPALLSHRNISCQAMCLSQGLLHGSASELVTLVNLPASHVGSQTELLMSTIFDGGTAVLLAIFDPLRSMKAIEQYRVTALGQIPAMFQFEWRLKEFAGFDLSSLDFAAYGGQAVSEAFLLRMAQMAPNVGTGLGLTEAAGFCTYVRTPSSQAAACAGSLGVDMPVYPMSIRAAMREDGSAGDELAAGELGHVCFRGPQTFLGYLNDPEATAQAISTDGYLYTGDMGRRDGAGLRLAGRSKLILKPAGYQVFPGDVENHFAALEGVAQCAAVGVPHPITSEAIIAFVELQPGSALEAAQLQRHARGLASYMRPHHYVVLGPGQLPLNRVAKADYLLLRERALAEVSELERQGKWMSATE